jgi:hypothetical protein
MHYPTDVLAGAFVGLGAGYVTARVAMPLLLPLIRLVSRLTDPLLEALAKLPPVREVVTRPSVRRGLVIVAGGALLALFAIRLRSNLLDEMPLLALAAWVGVIVLASRIAGSRGSSSLAP